MKRSSKARRPDRTAAKSPQAKRRQRSAKVAVRRDTMLLQSDVARRIDTRLAPPRYTERRRAKPGAGIKRSRASMAPKPR
ncbi:MAG TPA: hypothetical protein VFV05_04645 [Methylomirabilota bacterium]|nr:hypothetical protein [Methylomirabilota bacterium]